MKKFLAVFALLAVLVIAAGVWFATIADYSEGYRVGKVIKLSNKGYVFKTWEGTLGDGGRSVNFYDARTQRWNQVWVGDTGGVVMQQGVAVDLPNATGAALPQEDATFVVSVTVDGQLYLNDTKYDLATLTERLLAIREEKPAMVVYLRADNDSSYGNVVSVMAALKRAGVDKLGMITETGGA